MEETIRSKCVGSDGEYVCVTFRGDGLVSVSNQIDDVEGDGGCVEILISESDARKLGEFLLSKKEGG